MNVKYVGPNPSVDITVPGGCVRVEHGKSVEVPDEIGESLVEQGTFEAVKTAHKEKDV